MSGNMSGSPTGPAYVFAETDLVDIRRYCGYPPLGTQVVIFPEPWYFRFYLAMETRLSNLVSAEAQVVLARLGELRTLEAAIPAAGGNLDTDQAAVWFHNKNEVRDRNNLFRTWRKALCDFLGIPPGPYLKTSGIQVVV